MVCVSERSALCRVQLTFNGSDRIAHRGACLLQRVSDVAAGHKVAGSSCELYYKEIKLLV